MDDLLMRELSTLPPEILFPGACVSHDVKCLTVGQRVMSVPHAATIRRLVSALVIVATEALQRTSRNWASVAASCVPCSIARMICIPVLPVMSLTT